MVATARFAQLPVGHGVSRKREFGGLLFGSAMALAVLTAGPAIAGGSNYGIVAGALPEVVGKVSEWPVPTPKFARDPAPGPDGNIYVTVMSGNRIARFDPTTHAFTEWDLPDGARPHGLLVDHDGIVWYTGNGNGSHNGQLGMIE